mmetsp:Transcript_19499/g.40076  ORF Transcript_19499/g.40076 Transcript_19499/m.40076 type:complete len:214 (-) Transcript_19499:1136-1777(-)
MNHLGQHLACRLNACDAADRAVPEAEHGVLQQAHFSVALATSHGGGGNSRSSSSRNSSLAGTVGGGSCRIFFIGSGVSTVAIAITACCCTCQPRSLVFSPHGEHHTHAGHLVLRQGARFVGADDGGAPESLHARQFADDDVALRHAPGAEAQAQSDDGGQALGNGGHAQRHRHLEVVHSPSELPLDPGPKRRGAEAGHIDDPHSQAHPPDDPR